MKTRDLVKDSLGSLVSVFSRLSTKKTQDWNQLTGPKPFVFNLKGEVNR